MNRDNTKAILRLHTDLAAVMSDARFDDGRSKGTDLRAFVVAYLWARFEKPKDERWTRTLELAGLSVHRFEKSHTRYRWQELLRADAPRYEPPNLFRYADPCPTILQRGPRTGELCGKRGTYSFRVADPATGEWETRGWCRAHEADANAAREVERRKTNIPKPMPNLGGLLPGYIRATNWPDLYAAARSGWEPPSIGIDANDWPVLAKVAEQTTRPQLVAFDGDADGTAGEIPNLRLVSS